MGRGFSRARNRLRKTWTLQAAEKFAIGQERRTSGANARHIFKRMARPKSCPDTKQEFSAACLAPEARSNQLLRVTSDIQSIAAQFNKFYTTNYPLEELNPGNLTMGASVPAITNLAAAGAATPQSG
jgi:hypothetical protein